jgi:hypothetical protein
MFGAGLEFQYCNMSAKRKKEQVSRSGKKAKKATKSSK